MKNVIYIKDLLKDNNMRYLYNTMYECANKVGIDRLAKAVANSIEKYRK